MKEVEKEVIVVEDKEKRELTSWEKQKFQKRKRTQKIRLLKLLAGDLNHKLVTKIEDEKEYIEKLNELKDIQHQIFSLKNNKNNSTFFEWNPHMGVTRKQRRA